VCKHRCRLPTLPQRVAVHGAWRLLVLALITSSAPVLARALDILHRDCHGDGDRHWNWHWNRHEHWNRHGLEIDSHADIRRHVWERGDQAKREDAGGGLGAPPWERRVLYDE
jgi:hypothetical protein